MEAETQTDSDTGHTKPTIAVHENAASLLNITIKSEPGLEEGSTLELEGISGNGSQEDLHLPSHFLEEVDEDELKIPVWFCPICPQGFKKMSLIKQHMCIAHELQVYRGFRCTLINYKNA